MRGKWWGEGGGGFEACRGVQVNRQGGSARVGWKAEEEGGGGVEVSRHTKVCQILLLEETITPTWSDILNHKND